MCAYGRPASWGTHVFPSFYVERGDGRSPSTLSLWSDLESALAFSYYGLHAQALKRGREWFQKPKWPPYVAWWCEQNHIPDWREAVSRHALLHERGSTVEGFNFKRPFDAAGQPLTIDRAKVRSIADE